MEKQMLKEIKWKWFMLKVRFGLYKAEAIDKYMRRNYCRFGIHNIRSSYVGYGGSNQRMKHIRFLKCKHCNYLFFAKKSDKKRYEDYEQRTKGNASALFENLSSDKLKHLKSSVDSKSREVSVSSDGGF